MSEPHLCVGIWGGQKRVFDPLGLDLHTVMNHHVGAGNQIWPGIPDLPMASSWIAGSCPHGNIESSADTYLERKFKNIFRWRPCIQRVQSFLSVGNTDYGWSGFPCCHLTGHKRTACRNQRSLLWESLTRAFWFFVEQSLHVNATG